MLRSKKGTKKLNLAAVEAIFKRTAKQSRQARLRSEQEESDSEEEEFSRMDLDASSEAQGQPENAAEEAAAQHRADTALLCNGALEESIGTAGAQTEQQTDSQAAFIDAMINETVWLNVEWE